MLPEADSDAERADPRDKFYERARKAKSARKAKAHGEHEALGSESDEKQSARSNRGATRQGCHREIEMPSDPQSGDAAARPQG